MIIPVYNVAQYLRQSLDSVIAQSYSNLKVIIIDDGSEDGSDKICDEYAERDSRITVFHTENHGLSAARNYGLDHMSKDTEYVAFLDSDDWLEPDAMTKLQDAAEFFHADVVTCMYCKEYVDKSIISSRLGQVLVLNNDEKWESFINQGYIGDGVWNKLYKAFLFEDVRYPIGRVFEEVATTYKIIGASEKIVIIPEVLIHYRIRDNSISQTHSMENLIDCWQAQYEKYFELSRTINSLTCQKKMLISCFRAINRVYRWYYGCRKEDRNRAIDSLREMNAFVLQNKSTVLRGREYTFCQKVLCLGCLVNKSIILRPLYYINQFFLLFRCEKKYP